MPQQPETAPAIVSKATFAGLCGVDRSRVSHWIRDRKISGAALVGAGRGARIDVAVAQKQLRGNLDPYQRLPGGNGAGTKLDGRPPEPQGEPWEPAYHVWKHMQGVPAYAALVAMTWGADLRTAYLTYRSLALLLKGNLERSFGIEPPEPFDAIGFDFLTEEFGATLGPDDLAAWDHEFEHQWDEPEGVPA